MDQGQLASNESAMRAMCAEREEKLREWALNEGRPATVARHRAKGKLTARERIVALLDAGSPWLEMCALAGLGQDGAANTMIGGVGLVCGVPCLVSANQYTVQGGSINEAMLQKGARLASVAEENGLPFVTLSESAGANLTQQFRVFHRGGSSFRRQTELSRARVPVITAVFGNATAGGAYTPGMSDYVVMVREQAHVFLAGPPLVKMATGEQVDAETLGGARMHASVSGVADYLADDDLHAVQLLRQIVAALGLAGHQSGGESAPPAFPIHAVPPAHWAPVRPPLYPASDLLRLAPADIRRPCEARELVARLVDGSRLAEFKRDYGPTLLTCFARIHGFRVGVLANNGVLLPESALKGAQFIQLCNQKHVPLLFLQNITGFMVGQQVEAQGIIKAGAKMINAVSNSTVPAITVMVGASYGAGNYAMCGRAYSPRFLFAWPNSRVSVMGPEQLAGVLDIVARESARKAGRTVDEDLAAAQKQAFEQQVTADSSCYKVTSHAHDDGIIDPRDTRNVLGFCLSVCYNRPVHGTMAWGVQRL